MAFLSAGARDGKARRAGVFGATIALLILAACEKAPPADKPATPPPTPAVPAPPPAAPAPPPAAPVHAPAPMPAARPTVPAPMPITDIDDYKQVFAEKVRAANPNGVFSGSLPPMMRSIVVLDISIGADGTLTHAAVHRSRNGQASRLALAAVKKVGPQLPKPGALIKPKQKTLNFSETFLFNDEFKFQIRTLSGPQVIGQ